MKNFLNSKKNKEKNCVIKDKIRVGFLKILLKFS